MHDPRTILASLFHEAVRAADPNVAIRANLPAKPKGRTIVVGAGKAATAMAMAFDAAWDTDLSGCVVVPHGSVSYEGRIEICMASHPVPDEAGMTASARMLAEVSGLSSDDLVVALISGGGSSLLPAPPPGFSLKEEIVLNEALLASGAPISAMNTVRKHFSRIKGGRLAAAAAPAKVVTLVISDVPGDIPAWVASGPTIADDSSRADAIRVLQDYNVHLPPAIVDHFGRADADAPSSRDAALAGHEHFVISSARVSLEAARSAAEALGLNCTILSDSIEGEARDIGRMHAALAREIALASNHTRQPIILLSGGETTVGIRDNRFGKGGRNSEFLLSLALDIEGLENITALAADTDGKDGSENNAGAFADGSSVARMRRCGVEARSRLQMHDAWTAFSAVGDLFETGLTGTNVNDFRGILISRTTNCLEW